MEVPGRMPIRVMRHYNSWHAVDITRHLGGKLCAAGVPDVPDFVDILISKFCGMRRCWSRVQWHNGLWEHKGEGGLYETIEDNYPGKNLCADDET